MTLTTVITVGLGLILVYYLLGLIVNILTQIVKDVLELRAKSLEKMLKDLLETPDGAETKGLEVYEALMAQPLIQSLKPLYGHCKILISVYVAQILMLFVVIPYIVVIE